MVNIAVIGGGAAGLIAAAAAADNGAKVTVFEKNEKIGKKLFITGKGRCNVTNDCDPENFFEHVMCSNKKFLYSSYYGFDNIAVMDFFEKEGCPLKVERGNRVFPVSDHSSDVIRALKNKLEKSGVVISLNSEIKDIITEEKEGEKIFTGLSIIKNNLKKVEKFDKVIVATGGVSYPSTGSTGDGHRFAGIMGHTVSELKPSLVPLTCAEKWCESLAGLSLKNVTATLVVDQKEIYSEMGEMLFTHEGVSGPLILTASSVLAGVKKYSKAELFIDLKPALSKEQFDKRLIRELEEGNLKEIKNILGSVYPSSLIPVILNLANVSSFKKANVISKEERNALVTVTKKLPLTITGTGNFNEAIITKGGVSLKEIKPQTMESKLVKGVYFAGEVLDLDAQTGGYNLQIAWSTGHLAGESAALME